jgi:hypothetical protein
MPSGDRCEDAIALAAGVVVESLRGRTSAEGGACGGGGPDVVFTLDVAARADVLLTARGRAYEPIVGVLPESCVAGWQSAGLLCSRGVTGVVRDVAPGTRLQVVVGIDPDDPALETLVAEGVPDALEFELRTDVRPVLGADEVCQGSSGRCQSGTACLPAADGGIDRCIALAGDTCGTADVVRLESASTRVVVPADAMQTDAHAHGCGGARVPERVYRIELEADTRAPARLDIAAQGPVALAVRAAGCDAAREVACAPIPAAGGAISVDLDADAIREGVFVFVELPAQYGATAATDGKETGGEEAPPEIVLDFSIA